VTWSDMSDVRSRDGADGGTWYPLALLCQSPAGFHPWGSTPITVVPSHLVITRRRSSEIIESRETGGLNLDTTVGVVVGRSSSMISARILVELAESTHIRTGSVVSRAGTVDLGRSHCWVEFNGRIARASLTSVDRAEIRSLGTEKS
jgi:hypothetical protein